MKGKTRTTLSMEFKSPISSPKMPSLLLLLSSMSQFMAIPSDWKLLRCNKQVMMMTLDFLRFCFGLCEIDKKRIQKIYDDHLLCSVSVFLRFVWQSIWCVQFSVLMNCFEFLISRGMFRYGIFMMTMNGFGWLKIAHDFNFR